ncbi:hypothetical protein LOK49_LG05G00433 [Camellia lanceoleosa]|uniref:Uncharacterized protein n=1 Tax=Camellia lanceoleosa TaxID=1840588 RepID=A0ACC0HUD5_9ERIC|nr:hypothetical protein LOK49_LG05G00433 [Camellia lanceoleosa]
MVSEDHSRRRLIFHGDRSFEFEEGQEDGIGCRRVEIVERGQGLRRNIDLVGAEIKWVATQLLRVSSRVANEVLGLPIHLRGEQVFRAIRDRCGGFLATDVVTTTMESLGCIRLKVRGSGHGVPPQIHVRWGHWRYVLPVWLEEGLAMERWGSPEFRAQ